MNRITSPFEGSGSNSNLPSSTSEGGLAGTKFARIRDSQQKRKLEWFRREAQVNRYAGLKMASPNDADDVRESDAYFLTDVEEAAVQKRVEEDLQQMEIALKDPIAFKKYFFDDLVPIIQANTWSLTQLKQYSDPEVRDRFHQNTRNEWNNTSELTFKLLLSSLPDISSDSLRGWLLRSMANLTTQFGLNHSALQIGPYLMDWNDGELVIPRSFKAKNAVLLIPINQNVVLPKTDEVLNKISQFVVDWNRNWKYGRNNKGTRHGNCQFFVEQMFQYLGVTTSWMKNGPIEKHIDKLKNNVASPDALKIWDENGEHEFPNHQALRDYYESVVRTDNNPRKREEFMLVLKSIERCMMFRYWATKNENDQFKVESPIFNQKFKTANRTVTQSGPSGLLFSGQSKDDDGPEFEDEGRSGQIGNVNNTTTNNNNDSNPDDFSDFPLPANTGSLLIS